MGSLMISLSLAALVIYPFGGGEVCLARKCCRVRVRMCYETGFNEGERLEPLSDFVWPFCGQKQVPFSVYILYVG